jgi:diguanylate cyclase (GGDEF)-like protein/PAS domain S-box-containing protein
MHMMWPVRARGLLRWLPEGGQLSREDRNRRHQVLLWLVWLHALALFGLGLGTGNGLEHSLLESLVLVPWALAAGTRRLPSRARACAASLGLLTASAVLVHLMGGAIEAHFHFFVMIAVIALYQDWLPFLLAVGFVVFEHGLGGVLVPSAVYDHPDAWQQPWKWVGIHAVFVLGACAALVSHWRLSELQQTQRRRAEQALRESQRALAALLSNLPGMAYRCDYDPEWTNQFVSEGSLELTGYTPDELAGMRYVSLIHPNDRHGLWTDTQRAVTEQRPYQREYRIQTKEGSERWVLEQGRAVRGPEGQVVALEGFISDISERRRAAEELAHQAQHDPLTDLPNRSLLRHALQDALHVSKAPQLGLLMMDLDHFKEVNDTFGHLYGDQLLQQVGARLQGAVGEAGTLARLGGDEFGVLLPAADANEAIRVAQQLLSALDAPFLLEGHTLALGASVGISLSPEHAADAETLLRYADVAMYVAKRSGGGVEMYSAEHDRHSADRLALASELRRAIEDGQLVLYYQPTIDCSRGQINGVEALVRWQHPRRGLIPPDQFIPLAEQSGVINALTQHVLQVALRQCRTWLDAGLELCMSVNLSMRNLHDPKLPESISTMLAAEGVPPELLNLEITEGTIMADAERALAVLEQLRALGVRIAIDDFGTGYSSMAYLKGMPVDALKIDRSFVRKLATDQSDRAIVRSAVELGHNLGLKVVAEGVEDVVSYQQLARLGCDLAQGYYMGRPMPAADFEGWLATAPFGLELQQAA